MAQESRLVHIVDDVPELESAPDEAHGLVLIHALDGFLDAGNAAQLAAQHLAATAGPVVASFAVDELYDYRARRPPMSFVETRYEGYDAPRLVVRMGRDRHGAPYLLLHGPEPDVRWEGFAQAVRSVVEHFGVRLTVGLGAVPMAVPHTRPVMLTNHATSADLLVQENVWKTAIRVPSSAQSLLELRLGEWGHPASGFVAHIPHYLAQLDYPAAAAALLESVQRAAGLEWDLAALHAAGEAKMVEIAAQIDDSDEVREVVRGLEQQYDAFHRGQSAAEAAPGGGTSLPLAEDGELPTGEEIGAEFERFLARLDRRDRPDE